MNLEEKTVRVKMPGVKNHIRDKEWWYTGIFDPETKLYFSFFFVRSIFVDQFSFCIFDPANNKALRFIKSLYLKPEQEKNCLSLNYSSRKLHIGYNGSEKDGWVFDFKNPEYTVHFDIKPTAKVFTKYDNCFVNHYTIMHFFHSEATGFIKTPHKKYVVDKGLCYYDHAFGRVPARTGWHWIAVQNEDVALASLVNYGVCPQNYTQVYFKKSDKKVRLNEWIRLNQDVSFEYDPGKKFETDWKVTSCDMDLTVSQIMHTTDITKVPPVLPFFIDLAHTEFFIKADGRIRVDNEWYEIEGLYGVMEEHSGRW